ncbi:hypothetical protein [Agrobacterium tumefaciens]|uniref:Uncharacterized protein n=2 Tax=Agrobacterium tumefaciens TaxID=358 RepID=A0AA44F6I1_AGRTU|nr:hypothetical protein [Agrobacterium tumefaciens]NSL25101.1 hypothetical protein [Agrobacterium tumefaciens]NTB86754.1 hypothetical protein [Agrobacterium tumefaciens]NTC21083.1 hypothetical protein [Agrobacterium tumefaciens]NTC30631.1 hypothetical protein [Agrobacterium tumefaciens]NTC57707.1 hypothetical protein [Agrobacterium tumefaciens]
MSAYRITSFLLILTVLALSSCDAIGLGNPPTNIVEQHMRGITGPLHNTKVSNCSGDDNRKSCVVSYNRSFSGYQYYEELNMDFQKTPSGWNVLRYRVIKTDNL